MKDRVTSTWYQNRTVPSCSEREELLYDIRGQLEVTNSKTESNRRPPRKATRQFNAVRNVPQVMNQEPQRHIYAHDTLDNESATQQYISSTKDERNMNR